MKIRIFDKLDGIKCLGPGIRFVVWVQGCKKRCPDCMTPGSRDLDGGYVIEIADLAKEIIDSEREGITVSGGEPFLQASVLAELIAEVRKTRDIGVVIYTGYTIEELSQLDLPGTADLLECCDLLVDGPYIDELNDGLYGRGSSNQRAIPLTDRYKKEALVFGTKKPSFEMFVSMDRSTVVGIPPKNILKSPYFQSLNNPNTSPKTSPNTKE